MIESPFPGAVARQFDFPGEVLGTTPYGNGHINDTYLVKFREGARTARCVLQRINRNVFRNPPMVMQNVARVTAHLKAQFAGQPDAARRVMDLLHARDGQPWVVDAQGDYWRSYRYIDGVRSHETIENTAQAFEAARAFGEFQQQLANLPAPRLHETIPDFHHTPKRFAALEAAIAADPCQRAATARAEIAFALARKPMASLLVDAQLPERVTHNDTKINNLLLDETSGTALCVIDLDTVMPGLALYDFGDMVRTATSPADEDERDLAKVTLRFPIFEALVRGYLSAAGGFLTRDEKRLLAVSGKLITFETGIRFLTDYLLGDTYFRIHRPEHNLDRCRTQFKLIESIEAQEAPMQRLVEEFL